MATKFTVEDFAPLAAERPFGSKQWYSVTGYDEEPDGLCRTAVCPLARLIERLYGQPFSVFLMGMQEFHVALGITRAQMNGFTDGYDGNARSAWVDREYFELGQAVRAAFPPENDHA